MSIQLTQKYYTEVDKIKRYSGAGYETNLKHEFPYIPFYEKFNPYQFADDKEQVIGLLMRVYTVSVEAMKVMKEMQ